MWKLKNSENLPLCQHPNFHGKPAVWRLKTSKNFLLCQRWNFQKSRSVKIENFRKTPPITTLKFSENSHSVWKTVRTLIVSKTIFAVCGHEISQTKAQREHWTLLEILCRSFAARMNFSLMGRNFLRCAHAAEIPGAQWRSEKKTLSSVFWTRITPETWFASRKVWYTDALFSYECTQKKPQLS